MLLVVIRSQSVICAAYRPFIKFLSLALSSRVSDRQGLLVR